MVKTVTVTSKEAARMVKNYDSGHFFSVQFVKRTDATVRTMTCRKGVKKYSRGNTTSFKPSDKNLVRVWEVNSKTPEKAYRMINLDDVLNVTMNGKKYVVK